MNDHPANDSFHTVPSPPGRGSALPEPPAVARSDEGARRPPRYAIRGEVDRGAMGVVYRAHDTQLDREVAVKVLLDPRGADRFVVESRVTARLPHPGIPPVYSLGRLRDGRLFLAMKLVRGRTLRREVERAGPTDRGRLLEAFARICEAVGFAHSRGIVHRDLKPANVMVGDFGEVYVMDWGLAKVVGAGADDPGLAVPTAALVPDETVAGAVKGTPAYMAPEQARGEPLDARADVFALGGILAAVLTGKAPFGGTTVMDTILQAAQAELDGCFGRLDACGADPELVSLAKWCLSAKASDRPADGNAVAAAVAAYRAAVDERLRAAERERAGAEARAAEAVKTRREAEARAAEQRKRRRAQALLSLAVLLLVSGAGAFAWWRGEQRADRERREGEARATEQARKERNAEAVSGLLDQAEAALKAGNADEAAKLLGAADKRAAEGGAEELTDRLTRRREDLALLRELDRTDQFRWTAIGGRLPDPKKVSARYRAALAGFGADPDAADPAAVEARVSASALRGQLLGVLDRLHFEDRSARVREALRRLDPDPYREAARDADGPALVALVGRAALSDQPPEFLVALGRSDALSIEQRRAAFRVGAERHPAARGLLRSLGETYSINRTDEADERVRWYQALLAAAPDSAAAHIHLGIALYETGDVAGAVAVYRQAVRLDPASVAAHTNLGNALASAGEFDQAIAAHTRATELAPTSFNAFNNLAVARMGKGDLDGAAAAQARALELAPDSPTVHANWGDILAAKGEPGRALAAYRRALELDPGHANSHNNLGRVLEAENDLDGAVAAYRRAVDANPRFALAHINLGVALRKKGDSAGSLAAYNRAVGLAPKNSNAHFNLALALLDTDDLVGPVVAARRAVELDPTFGPAHAVLGDALRRVGDLTGAIAAYRKALDRDPKNLGAHNNLGLALRDTGHLDGAAAAFEAVIETNPRLALAHANLGYVYLLQKKYRETIACARAAIQIDPQFANAHALLGDALQLSGDSAGARAAHAEAVRLAPKQFAPPSATVPPPPVAPAPRER